jgi:cytochrome c5
MVWRNPTMQPLLLVIGLCACSATLATHLAAHPQNPRPGSSVWDGVYTTAQAARGQQVYAGHCARCHGEDLGSSRNPLAGERFAEHWESRTLADLFRRIRDTMPAGDIAAIEEPSKLDAMAFLLQQNGFPDGHTELTPEADALAMIRITGKDGPTPIRTGTLVRTVGCLELRNDRDWRLTNATEPERAALDTTSESRDSRLSPSTGAGTVVLLNPFPSPTSHRDHRVAATGFLVRRADGDAVNVVSLEVLAASCTP